jgi:tetratricopeptide (TPR) repeat protein
VTNNLEKLRDRDVSVRDVIRSGSSTSEGLLRTEWWPDVENSCDPRGFADSLAYTLSRSEHGNARDRTDPVDRARKRRIKRLSVAERQPRLLPELAAAAIPIVTVEHGPYVHWPASAADLRGVMDRLPTGTLTGIGCVAQVLSPAEDDELDPFVGRLSTSIVTDVYSPETLGDYDPDGARIQLYAYVYDPDGPQREVLELYLRLTMLATFVHEVGHHVDFHNRFSRHRARADRKDRREHTAQSWAELRVADAVVPYLEQAYPRELAELRRWLLEHGGAAVPLEVIERSGYLFDPFETLLGDVIREKPATETKIDFAFHLHYDYHFDLALEILDGVLASEPDHIDAASWRSHVLGHLGRDEEADAIARALLERAPEHVASLTRLLRRAREAEDFATTLEFANRLLALPRPNRHVLPIRARAHIALGNLEAAKRDLDQSIDDPAHEYLTSLWRAAAG